MGPLGRRPTKGSGAGSRMKREREEREINQEKIKNKGVLRI